MYGLGSDFSGGIWALPFCDLSKLDHLSMSHFSSYQAVVNIKDNICEG